MTNYRLPINGVPNRMRSPHVSGDVLNVNQITDPFFNNVSLLMHFNGTNDSTNFIDQIGNTVTRIGGTIISTTQFKYGGAAGFFDGTGDYLTIPISTSLNILSGDFTIEFWYYHRTGSNISNIVGQWKQSTGEGGFQVRTSGNELRFFLGSFSESSALLSGGTLTINTWHHIAITRNGNSFNFWLNGNSIASATNSTTRSQLTTNIAFGNVYNSSGVLGVSTALNDLSAYLDDVRITKGVARYTANFTPPTSEFSDS